MGFFRDWIENRRGRKLQETMNPFRSYRLQHFVAFTRNRNCLYASVDFPAGKVWPWARGTVGHACRVC